MDQLDSDLLKASNLSANRYATRPGGFEEIRKELVLRMTGVMLVCTIIVYAILFSRNGFMGGWVGVVPYLIPLGAMVYALVNVITKQRVLFESFILTVEDDAILRQQRNMPDMRILKKDISYIKRNSRGVIIIKGAGFQDLIAIPAQMEAREQLERELSAISPIIVGNQPFWQKGLGVVCVVAFLGVAYLAFTSPDRMITAVAGVLFSASFALFIILAARSKHLENRLRWGILIAVVPWLSFSYTIYNRWKSIPAHTIEIKAVEGPSNSGETNDQYPL